MPTDLVNRINLGLLYPPYLDSFLETVTLAKERGVYYFATLGTRTFQEQDLLFAKGRTAPGPKVTDAPGGKSMHNYGLAVDLVRDADMVKVGLQPSWDERGYEILKECAESVSSRKGMLPVKAGLTTGSGKRYDFGHLQVDIKRAFGVAEREIWTRFQKDIKDKSVKEVWVKFDSLRLGK